MRQSVFGFTFAALLILAGVAFLMVLDATPGSVGGATPVPVPGPAVVTGEGSK